jgi:hypothetical protein
MDLESMLREIRWEKEKIDMHFKKHDCIRHDCTLVSHKYSKYSENVLLSERIS